MKKQYCSLLFFFSLLLISCNKSDSNAVSSNSTSGSVTRFTLAGNYLYTINQQSLKTFNVTNPANPVLESTVHVGPDIETIFPFKGNLFIGSNTTAYVYSLSTPGKPAPSSAVSYIVRGRDPIVANDTLAYATLRNFGTNAGGMLNIINVKNPLAATLTNQLQLTGSPYGLGLADTALYVCTANAGMLVYSLKDSLVTRPAVRKLINDGETYYDVIPAGNLLYTWVDGGNCIFNITSRMNPVLLSKTKN